MTYTEELAQVQAAITAILERGQSYTIKDRQLTRANLAELLAERKRLQPLVAREARGGVRMRYGTVR